ncbi:IS1 family transposase [Escherichia coli]
MYDSVECSGDSVSISCPSSATDGGCITAKAPAGHQRYLCSRCRKHWQLQFTYTASRTRYAPEKSLIWP